jgi:hypothetical protein
MHGYNRDVPIHFKWLLCAAAAIILSACHSSTENKDAVQRGIMDRLNAAGLSTQNMDVDINKVEFHGSKADADVEVRPKGATHGQGMQMRYTLENQSGKWVVVGRADTAGHGAAIMPGATNPHGGAMPAGAMPDATTPGGQMPPDHGRMPSPQDLPPAGKKR